MDLEAKYPDFMKFKEYLGNFSTRRNCPIYTISRTGETSGRPLPRTISEAEHLGPGYYPVEVNFPTGRSYEEVRAGLLTRSAAPRKCNFKGEDRQPGMDRWRILSRNPGPGHYESLLASNALLINPPKFTVSETGAEDSRPMPRAKSAADHLGPGIYQMPNRFTDLSWRKHLKLEQAAKRNHETGHASQYSHIFHCLKPGPRSLNKASSTGALPSASLAMTH